MPRRLPLIAVMILTRMNKLRFSIIFALVLLCACDSAAPPRPVGEPATVAQRPQASQPRPTLDGQAIASAFDVEVDGLTGQNFKLADFRGKVMVIDFWATYCGPCVRQMPQLAALSKKYKDRGLTVVGLTADDKADQEKVNQFLKRAGAEYTIGYDNRWLSAAFLKGTEDETGAPPIPQLFVISREGRVVEHLIGDSPQRGIAYLEEVVSRQLNATP